MIPLRLVAPALSLALLAACSQKPAEPEPLRAVRTEVLKAADAGQQLVFAGELRARTESRLGFRVPGKVSQRLVGLGQAVKPGQVLMTLDPADLRLAADAAQAQLLAAKASRDSSQADIKRFRELRQQGFISAADLERREASHQASLAQYEQASAQARVQGNQLQYGGLVADAAGIITSVDAEPGTVVAAGTPVLRLAHDGPRDVVFNVAEQQAAGLRELAGEGRLTVRLPGRSEPIPAKLREVAQAADPVTRTFVVKADVGRPADALVGQTATVYLEAPKLSGSIRLPMSAVFDIKGQPQVFVLDPQSMQLRAQAIQVAGAEGNQVLVASGLSAGQEVVTAGVHVLRAGEKVRRFGVGAPAPAAAASK